MRRGRPDLDLEIVTHWCAKTLGSRPRRVLFETGYLSQVLGLELADDRRVVVKVRPWLPRLAACAEVHSILYGAGYPCPEPLTDIETVERWAVSAEALIDEHRQLEPAPDSPRLFAEALAQVLHHTSAAPPARDLYPSPPWADWDDPSRAELWPAPDDRDVNLNGVPPTWVDTAAGAAREHLQGLAARPAIGHLDWYSANLGWLDRQLVAVFDWDSIGTQPEAAIAGLAAAVWPATGGPGEEATVHQSEQFLRAYTQTRPLTDTEIAAAWAAGLWVRCFDAKKAQAVGDDPEAVITRREARTRLRLAELPDDL